jgi:hypothetical protein
LPIGKVAHEGGSVDGFYISIVNRPLVSGETSFAGKNILGRISDQRGQAALLAQGRVLQSGRGHPYGVIWHSWEWFLPTLQMPSC